MICPWCNQEMEKGFLQSSRAVIFGPEIRESALWPPKKGEVKLTKGFWSMPSAAAWHCSKCKRVVVEYE